MTFPFSTFDFFGYIIAGLVFVGAAATAIYGPGSVAFPTDIAAGAILLLLAYVSGQALAGATHSMQRRIEKDALTKCKDRNIPSTVPTLPTGYWTAIDAFVRQLGGDQRAFKGHCVSATLRN
jgi:hypothetical protein